jgi:hypothetical protein
VAADAGYADQAHLTREARLLEGRSPPTLLLESEQRCGCGHDHSVSNGPLLRPGHARAAIAGWLSSLEAEPKRSLQPPSPRRRAR